MTATYVSYGILEGNLWDGADADGYRQTVEEALGVAFPDAEIRVKLYPGQGSTPSPAKLFIECDDGTTYDAGCNHPLVSRAEQVIDGVEPVYAEESA
jgi:hypothetical protein